ncbi:MAG: GGDEF domain-containing protein [Pseudobacteriovorax sp.]|nr:GGDEF domain-containing protein [Pseudobacteriovorax sp.]
MNPPVSRWLRRFMSFLVPTRKLANPLWKDSWESMEKKRFRSLSRLFFVTSAAAYILHFFFIDYRLGKTPIELWAAYRFGLATVALIGFSLSFNRRFVASKYYKLPVAVAGVLFSWLQAETMLWYAGIPYFYAFIIPCLTAVVLRLNLISSLGYLTSIHMIQLSSFMAADVPAHLLLSASVMSYTAVIVFRANMFADVNAFVLEQMKDEMQLRLNKALNETRKKEKAVAIANEGLMRKNAIFHTLLESATNLPHFQELRDLLEYAAKEFEDLFQGCGILLVISDQSTQLLQEAIAINVEAGVKKKIVSNYHRLLDRDYLIELRSDLFGDDKPQYPCDNVISLPMVSSADKIVGTAVMIGVSQGQETLETLSLFLALVTSCAENLALTKRLEYLAHTDHLTSTFNRNFFERELKRHIRTNQEFPDLHFSLLLIDVNGLKHVNDYYGHKEGDNLIVKVAGLLKSTCRKTDVVCRLGGDEFVILCPETKNATCLTDRLKRREEDLYMVCHTMEGKKIELPVRFSIGQATTLQHPADSILKYADEKMYENKREYYEFTKLKKSS